MKTPLSVLLVEDNEDDQFFFSEALRALDNKALYSVASNGRKALAILSKMVSLPDIIFTDINMPVMNGIEFLSALMKDPRIKNIPVVILSSDTSVAGITCDLGARAFIKKPISIEKLEEHLQKILDLDLSRFNPIAFETCGAVGLEPMW